MNGKIAFQGEPGANSHIACTRLYPDMDILPCRTFDNMFQSLKQGYATYALAPIENNFAGRVSDVHRLLPNSEVYIIGEYFMPIEHFLLGVEGAQFNDITHVHSHEMAIGQCRKFFATHKLSHSVTVDTAGAAQMIAAMKDKTQAAIASKLAGEIYGLSILKDNIEDDHNNSTRFLVLSRTPDDATPQDAPIITSLIFRLRNIPAALYKALGGFATNNVNMVKLESYYIGGQFATTQFYADIEGHPEDETVRHALAELEFFSTKVDILGVYKAAPARAHMNESILVS